jgi:hypothetical protein
VRELWEYNYALDLKTVFTWRDEVGVKRGVLYEDGKVEFDKWPVPPHEDIIDIFENFVVHNLRIFVTNNQMPRRKRKKQAESDGLIVQDSMELYEGGGRQQERLQEHWECCDVDHAELDSRSKSTNISVIVIM